MRPSGAPPSLIGIADNRVQTPSRLRQSPMLRSVRHAHKADLFGVLSVGQAADDSLGVRDTVSQQVNLLRWMRREMWKHRCVVLDLFVVLTAIVPRWFSSVILARQSLLGRPFCSPTPRCLCRKAYITRGGVTVVSLIRSRKQVSKTKTKAKSS